MMRSRRTIRRRAFTLIELIGTITIIGAIGSVVSLVVMTVVDDYVEATTRVQLHNELSLAVDRCIRELREIGLDSGAGSVAPDIDNTTASSITWATNNGISLSGSTVNLTLSGTDYTLLEDVTAFTVTCYDEAGTALGATLTGASCDAIRRVQLEVTLTRAGVSESLRTQLYLRLTMAGAPA